MTFGAYRVRGLGHLVVVPRLLCISCERQLQPDDSGVVMHWAADDGFAMCAWCHACFLESLGLDAASPDR